MEAGSKSTKKFSFCSFCQYLGSNDQSYINHIICGHYDTNYGCGKCLDQVYIMGQSLHQHMKTCKGLSKEAMDKATAEDTDGTTFGKKKKKESKSKIPLPDSQPPPPNSQESSQVSPHHSQCTKRKVAMTPKKSDSSKKKKHFCSHKHHGKFSKDKDKSSDHHKTKSTGTSKDKYSETSKDKSSEQCKTKSSGTAKTSLVRPARTSPASTAAKASLARRSKAASLDMGSTFAMSYTSSCRLSSCFTMPLVVHTISW